jgi:PPOX class probable F420-dependent enzyme
MITCTRYLCAHVSGSLSEILETNLPSHNLDMTGRSQLSPAEVAFVQAQRVAHLATADAEGNPYVVPVCFAFDGTRFFLPLDEKPKNVGDQALRRVRNIEARPQVALLMDRYAEDWSRLGYVLVRGRATLMHPSDPARAPALLLLRERYQQYRTMALEERAMIAILPYRVVSWGSLDDDGSGSRVLRDEGIHVPREQ